MQDELGAVLHMLVDVDNNKYVTHVICRSIMKAKTLYEKLDRNQCGKCGLITGQCDSDDVKDVLSRWTRGDLSTLITTSTAVAGIDSSHVNRVIFYGLPYSLMFIHQGVGRLRQRGSVEFVVDIPSNLDLDNLSPSIFSEEMVTKWLLDKSCRVRRFNQLFSGVITSPCKICDVCIRSSFIV